MLKDLNLKVVYDSSIYDLVKDLFVPLLQNSRRYDRGVGFFSSGWLKLASVGLADLAGNSGHIKIVMSPIISEDDWEAMKKGDKAKVDAILYESLMRTVSNLEKSLEKTPLNALAWMIADNLMEIKFAIPKGRLSGGDFHDKFAIFEDEYGDRVAIHGSYNDSIHASLNGESFSVFKSWEEGQIEYVNNHDERFRSLWRNRNHHFEIYDIPEAVKDCIIKYRLRNRPYVLPTSTTDKNFSDQKEDPVELRDYQIVARKNWEQANFKGIFEMATGTGKTFTALACASRVRSSNSPVFFLVSVPYLHLIEQWQREMQVFGFNPHLCSSANPKWDNQLQLKIQDYNLGYKKKMSCITTHKTAATKKFQSLLNQIKQGTVMGIFDEVHHLGANKLNRALSEIISHRLGLSATPQRWFDIQGTGRLMDYFNGVCYSFPLEEAIGKFLVEYRYIPHAVELTSEEFEGYCGLSKKISRIYQKDDLPEQEKYLESLLRARAKIINDASNKFARLEELLDSDDTQGRSDSTRQFIHTLFYCPVGKHSDVLKLVSDKGILASQFIYKVKNEDRKKILKHFSNGDLHALVAMKCLDEGVDVPATKVAFILASTTNPREFVQRRGRILRRYKNKREAIIHDFIVIPPSTRMLDNSTEELKKSVLRREMPRFAEFSSSAKNGFEARRKMWDILDRYDLLHLLDQKPWEIYKANHPEYLDSEKMEEE